MSAGRLFAMVVVTGVVMIALGYGSRAPYTPPGADGALLRLSWRLRGEKHQTCRDRTEAELAALPVHMRTPQICTDRLLSYRLIVRVDDEPADTLALAPAGAKGDRPIFVLHDRVLAPGDHDVSIDFAPDDHGQPANGPKRPLSFVGRITFQRGEVALVTLAPDQSRLVVLSPAR